MTDPEVEAVARAKVLQAELERVLHNARAFADVMEKALRDRPVALLCVPIFRQTLVKTAAIATLAKRKEP